MSRDHPIETSRLTNKPRKSVVALFAAAFHDYSRSSCYLEKRNTSPGTQYENSKTAYEIVLLEALGLQLSYLRQEPGERKFYRKKKKKEREFGHLVLDEFEGGRINVD